MKKLICFTLLLFSSLSFAQIESFDSTYINGIKSNVKTAIKDMVKDNMKMSEEEANIFWPMLDAYLADYETIAQKRTNLTEEYMMNYYGMDNETAKDLLGKSIKLEEEILAVKKAHMDKMLEKLPAMLVGMYFQIDARAFALVNVIRMSSVPLVRDGKKN